MDILGRVKSWLAGLGTVGLILAILGLFIALLLVMPVLTLMALNHLNEAFGWGWNSVDPFNIWNILATAVVINVLGGIFGRASSSSSD